MEKSKGNIKNINMHAAILTSVWAVHLILAILFFKYHIVQFGIINLASMLLCNVLIIMTRKGHYMLSMTIVFTEIVLNACYATCILPTEAGFYLYVLGIVPVCCYDIHILVNLKHKIRTYAIAMIAAFVMIVACFVMSDMGVFQKYPMVINGIQTMSTVNYALVLILMAVLSAAFIMKINVQMDDYEDEIEKYEEMAYRDSLTGLYTRRYMEGCIETAIKEFDAKNEPFTLVMLDIDNFKEINDTFGHDSGDAVLVKVSTILSDCMKGFGEVGRWGGEEILLLVYGNAFQAEFMSEAIRRKIEAIDMEKEGQKISVTATFGIATYVAGDSVSEAVDRADDQMYIGKRNGRNQVVK